MDFETFMNFKPTTIAEKEFKEIILHKREQCNSLTKENTEIKVKLAEMEKAVAELQLQISNFKKPENHQPTLDDNNMEEDIFETDSADLAKETDWIRVTQRKKRKADKSLSPPTPTQGTVKMVPKCSSNAELKNKQKAENQIEEKEKNPPPIILREVENYQNLFVEFEKSFKNEFTMTLLNNSSVKINPKTPDAHRGISKFLSESKMGWYSYENKHTRPIRVVAKKLHHSYSEEQIVEYLKEKNYKIISATNKLDRSTKKPLDIFILSFQNDESIEKVYEIEYILNLKVEIQAFKKNKIIPQCKKCQIYGHTKGYCGHEPRCVKCAGKHWTIDCKRNDDDPLKCYHCGGNHPASYRGCSVIKALLKAKRQAMKNPKRTELEVDEKHKKTDKQATLVKPQKPQSIPSSRKTYSQISKDGGAETTQPQANNQQKYVNINKTLEEILNKLSNLDQRISRIESNATAAKSTKNSNA